MNALFRVATAFAFLALFTFYNSALAHEDLLVQRTDPNGSNKLLTGTIDFDALDTEMAVRVFESELTLVGDVFESDEPGFNAFSDASPLKPTGTFALPGGTALDFAIQSFTINSQISDLFYWDGMGAVSFAPAVLTTTLSFAGAVANDPLASKSGTIDITGVNGSLHKHHDFELESSLPGAPDEGVYLAQFILQMAGVNDSDPFWIVFGTEGTTHDAHEAAMDWVHANFVIPEPASATIMLLGAVGLLLNKRKQRN